MFKKVFTVHPSQDFLNTVAKYLMESSHFLNATIILPKEDDVIYFSKVLKGIDSFKIISFENIDKEFLLNMKDIKIIHPMRRLLLMMEFIDSWNKENDDNYPLSFSYELLNFLNDIYANDIPLSSLSSVCDEDLSAQLQKLGRFLSNLLEKWNVMLSSEGLVDILEYRTLYLNHLIEFWQNDSPDDIIIFAGLVFNKSFMRFLSALYSLPNSQIILPFIDLNMSDQYWQSMSEDNSQYYLKALLDYLSVSRTNIILLGESNTDFIVESLFNFDEWLENFHKSKIEEHSHNIKLICCDSHAQEAETIVNIMNEFSSEEMQLFLEDNLLFKRVNVLLKMNNMAEDNSNDYLTITFLLHSLNVAISNYDVVELLSLLKHPFVRLTYSDEEYYELLTTFEIKIVRFYQSNSLESIVENIRCYAPELNIFWKKVENSISHLIHNYSRPLNEILKAHISCLDNLSNSTFVLSESLRYLFADCSNYLTRLSGLNIYKDVLTAILYSNFFFNKHKLRTVSLACKKTVIIANFNNGAYSESLGANWLNNFLKKKIGLFTSDEIRGHFYLMMYSLFYANKIYITRASRSSGKINDEHALIKKLNLLLRIYSKKIKPYFANTTFNLLSVINDFSKPMAYVPFHAKLRAFSRLSATAIEKLINDPYSFYVRYILKIIPLEGVSQHPHNKDFGILVHKSLEIYVLSYKQLAHTVQQCYECLLEIANSYFVRFIRDHYNIASIWMMKFKKIAKHFSEIHVERRNIAINIEVEKTFYWRVSDDITVIVKCDRIEYFEDGSVEIIDYKTGNIPLQSDIENGFSPQLILQALAVEHNLGKKVRNLIYWKLGADDKQINFIKRHCEVIQTTKKELINFLNTYLYADIPFATSCNVDKSFGYIDYELLKRIGEWQLPMMS